jgi:maltose alpha-D-glucosyltransferase/alpha-amylase
VVVNPRRERANVDVPTARGARLLLGEGVDVNDSTVSVDGFGFGVWLLDGQG